jgi:hypothetical protein
MTTIAIPTHAHRFSKNVQPLFMTPHNHIITLYDDNNYLDSIPERSKTPIPFDYLQQSETPSCIVKHSDPIPIPIKKLRCRVSPWASFSPYTHPSFYSQTQIILSAPRDLITNPFNQK